VRVPFPAAEESPAGADAALRLFARGLLEGRVAPLLAAFTEFLALPPAAVTKRAPQARVLHLLRALERPPVPPPQPLPGAAAASSTAAAAWPTAVRSAVALAAVWRRYPTYLRTEVQAWLPVERHGQLDTAWPAIVRHFLAAWAVPAGEGEERVGGAASVLRRARR